MTTEQKGLRLAAAVTMLTGLALALAAFPPLAVPVRRLADLPIWPLDGAETLAAAEARLGLAIGGGVMAGWGAMIRQLTGAPYARDADTIRHIVLTSILIWFGVDGIAATLAGAALNVVAIMGFLALFLVPILALRRTSPGPA